MKKQQKSNTVQLVEERYMHNKIQVNFKITHSNLTIELRSAICSCAQWEKKENFKNKLKKKRKRKEN